MEITILSIRPLVLARRWASSSPNPIEASMAASNARSSGQGAALGSSALGSSPAREQRQGAAQFGSGGARRPGSSAREFGAALGLARARPARHSLAKELGAGKLLLPRGAGEREVVGARGSRAASSSSVKGAVARPSRAPPSSSCKLGRCSSSPPFLLHARPASAIWRSGRRDLAAAETSFGRGTNVRRLPHGHSARRSCGVCGVALCGARRDSPYTARVALLAAALSRAVSCAIPPKVRPAAGLPHPLRMVYYATVAGDLANIVLDPILIFGCRMGVVDAAIAHVLSQYLITLIMLIKLVRKVNVVPPSLKCLKFRRFLGCGSLLLARVVAVTFCVTLASSMAARQGPTVMAAFQICSQVWLATSLLADGLAVAGQAILASAFAKKDHYKVVTAAARVLQLGIVLGVALTVLLGLGIQFGAGAFTKDAAVIKTIHKAVPFVAGTQTLNTLAFVFDGVNFGASDYAFAAYSMVGVAAVSIPSVILLSAHDGFVGIWIALTIYMGVRAMASTWRMGAARGPWRFLRQ